MKKVVYKFLIKIFLILFFLSSSFLFAENAGDNSTVHIKVAFCPLEGFFEYDKSGKEFGYGVDYLNELSKYANITWDYIYAPSWEAIKQMMIDGIVDIQMPVSEPTKSSGKYNYSVESVITTYHAIMSLKSRSDLFYQDYETFSKKRIGITAALDFKTGVKDYFSSIGISPNLIYFDDYNSCYNALKEGSIDCLISNVMDQNKEMKILDKFLVGRNYIITLKDNPNYKLVNQAMTRLNVENPSFQIDLLEKYFPERVDEPLTKAESFYLQNHKTIKVAVYSDRKPVSFYDEKTKTFNGIAVDILRLFEKKLNITFDFVPISTEFPVEMISQVDLVMPFINNPNSDLYFLTNNLFNSDIIYAKKDISVGLKDGAKVGILESTKGIEQRVADLHKFFIIKFKSNREALCAVQQGKIDAFVNSSYVLNWWLENPRFMNLSTIYYNRISIPFNILGKNKDYPLQSILNKQIHSISEDDVSKIILDNVKFTITDISFFDELHIYGLQISVFCFVILVTIFLLYLHNKTRALYIKKIEESNQKQLIASRAKSDFLARMSHDMRTPLNVIIGMGNLAKENKNPPDTDDCIDKINVASDFLLGLINDILDMEHIESGKIDLHLMPYSSSEFKKYISSVIEPLCMQKNINFVYQLNGNPNFIVMQDKLRINQLFFNILSNAVKFTPEGGKIVFSTDVEFIENNKIRLTSKISDSGIGMSEEFQKHMFEPFSQENQVIKPISEGTGLGLAISKRISSVMGVSLSVESNLGRGSTFTIVGEYDISNSTEEIKKVDQEQIILDDNIFKNKIILVCEDHPLNQEIIKRQLEKKGMIVIIADNGKRGVEKFSMASPNSIAAILMDIRMPVMDGIEATKQIRELNHDDSKTVPIIAMTANAYEEDVKQCISVGMNAHLAKPVNPDILYKTLEDLIIKKPRK